MINDPTKIIFSSRYNFQKVYLEGTATLSLVSSLTPTEYTLATHSLGYIPTARVFYVPVTGELWPLSPLQYSNIDGGVGTMLQIYGSPVMTSSLLKVRMVNASGAPADVVFYYRIYLDE